VSTLLLGEVDTTLNWNWPVRLPLKFPPKAKDPLPVSPTKQELDEIVRLVTLSVPSLFSVIDVVRVNACDPSELFVSTAVQLPLMLPEFELLEPHPTSTRPAASNNATASFFIKSVFLFSDLLEVGSTTDADLILDGCPQTSPGKHDAVFCIEHFARPLSIGEPTVNLDPADGAKRSFRSGL
jgi:hypothetical protein